MPDHRLLRISPETHRVAIDLVYATDRNLTGKPIYKTAHCLLLAPAEAALKKAVELAANIGMTLKIFDAYRPPQAQQVLWDFLPDPTYIADLKRGSNHSRHCDRPDTGRRSRPGGRYGHGFRRDVDCLRALPSGFAGA